MPGCSPRGGDGQDGEEICPVQPSIGMEVGDATGVPLGEMVGLLGGAGVSTRGLESLFLPAPSGLTAPAPGGLSGAGQRGTGPCPSILSPGMSAPQQGGSAGPLDTQPHAVALGPLGLKLQSLGWGGLGHSISPPGRLCPLLTTFKAVKRQGTLSSQPWAPTLSLIALGISGAFGLF